MFNLNDIIQQAQGGAGLQNLASQFGLTEEQAQQAVSALAPALSAGLQTRTKEASGLADMFGAMFNTQHQQAFENPEVMAAPDTAAHGEDALARLFGNDHASQALAAHAAQATGIGSSILQSMIPVIVSMVMGGMFKGMQGSGMGGMLEQLGKAGANSPGNSSGGLGDLLGQVLGGSLGGGHAPGQTQGGGGLGGLLGGLLGSVMGGGSGGQQQRQPANPAGADQIFPQGLNPSSLQSGIDMLGKMLNPGGQGAAQGAQQPGLQDILGQILGGGRR